MVEDGHRVAADPGRGSADILREDAVKRVAPIDIVDETTGEVDSRVQRGAHRGAHPRRPQERAASMSSRCSILDPLVGTGSALRDTLLADKTVTKEEAIIDIYRRLRPGDPPTRRHRDEPLQRNLFFNPERYDLSRVGRLKLNHKLGYDAGRSRAPRMPIKGQDGEHRRSAPRRSCGPSATRTSSTPSGTWWISRTARIVNKRVDDIDHLGNRRVRVVGELLAEPIPHRSRAHGAGDQGAHVAPGDRDADAPRPDQLQAGLGRRSRSSSVRASSRSSWTRRTHSRR